MGFAQTRIHSHAGHMPTSGRGMAITAWLTGVYFIIEMGIGLWNDSIAVISDAFHTFSAVGGVLSAAHEMLKTKFGLFLVTLQVEKPALMKLVPRRSM